LVRGPAAAEVLISEARAAFNHHIRDDIYPGDARAALRNDFRALRREYACTIELNRQNCYELTDLGHLALLDLPDEDLDALAFLLANFSETSLPNAAQVDALLDRIIALLPGERRPRFERLARQVRLDYPRPSGAAADHVLTLIQRAVRRQQISFAYRSSYAEGHTVVQHRVAPYALFFRDGHSYLDAFCLACGLPDLADRYVTYRVDRLVVGSLVLLPDQLPSVAPPRPRFTLRYTLAAPVARQRDVALWFDDSVVVFQDDGSALISARTGDLWQARQILLRYREHCHVLEPPELITMMRESIQRMAQLYDEGATA
jgi:predicted DNA-binding transcriptional regulator YafY